VSIAREPPFTRGSRQRTGPGRWIGQGWLVAAGLVCWELAARLGLVGNSLPAFTQAASAWVNLLWSGTLVTDALTSSARVLAGFTLGGMLGIALGCSSAVLPRLAPAISNAVEIIRPVPPIAWIPLAILWFGVGTGAALFLVSLGAFFPVFVNAFHGVAAVPARYVNAARQLGASDRLILKDVLLPAALPQILVGLRVGLGTAWTTVIAAELVGAQSGLGYMIQLHRTMLQTADVIAGMVTIGMVGVAMDRGFRAVHRRLVLWARTVPGDPVGGHVAI